MRILGEQWRKRGERETRVAREARSAMQVAREARQRLSATMAVFA